MDGLLHITDLSWGRISHPSEVVHVGQELTLKVLKYVPEKERVSLGLKQLTPDPWEQVASEYQPGDRIAGRVVSVTDYGAFVELVAGIEGLVHWAGSGTGVRGSDGGTTGTAFSFPEELIRRSMNSKISSSSYRLSEPGVPAGLAGGATTPE